MRKTIIDKILLKYLLNLLFELKNKVVFEAIEKY